MGLAPRCVRVHAAPGTLDSRAAGGSPERVGRALRAPPGGGDRRARLAPERRPAPRRKGAVTVPPRARLRMAADPRSVRPATDRVRSTATVRPCTGRSPRGAASSASTVSPPDGRLSFPAEGDDGRVETGAEAGAGDWAMRARLPLPASARLMRDGVEVAAAAGEELAWRASEPGVYRVEAHRGERTWIVSNPVYLRAGGPVSGNSSRPSREPAPRAPRRTPSGRRPRPG